MQGLRETRCAGTETRIHRSPERTDFVRLPRTIQHARRATHLWRQPSDVGLLVKKKTKPIQPLKTRSCLPNPKMCWKPTKCGRLSTKNGTSAGFGRLCAVGHAKLWRLSSGIGVRQPAVHFGNKFRKRIQVAEVIAIFGKPINSSFLSRPMNVLGKEADRLITWNVGIAPYDNLAHGLSEKHYPFQNRMSCTKS